MQLLSIMSIKTKNDLKICNINRNKNKSFIENKIRLETYQQAFKYMKTRRGSPVDDRPSTDKLHHFVQKKK